MGRKIISRGVSWKLNPKPSNPFFNTVFITTSCLTVEEYKNFFSTKILSFNPFIWIKLQIYLWEFCAQNRIWFFNLRKSYLDLKFLFSVNLVRIKMYRTYLVVWTQFAKIDIMSKTIIKGIVSGNRYSIQAQSIPWQSLRAL